MYFYRNILLMMRFFSVVYTFKVSTSKGISDINVDLAKFVLEFIIDLVTNVLTIVFLMECFLRLLKLPELFPHLKRAIH